jgi:hypothetical protein
LSFCEFNSSFRVPVFSLKNYPDDLKHSIVRCVAVPGRDVRRGKTNRVERQLDKTVLIVIGSVK